MTCPFAHLDGSYVLGALAPAERQEFEAHLASCEECARAVRELAGLPGLLARVDQSVLESEPADEPVPETLLPALVAQVRRRRRVSLGVTAAAAAAAAAVLVGVPALVSASNDQSNVPQAGPSISASPTPVAEAMRTLGGAPVRGSVAFQDVAWGTKLDLTCTYIHHQTAGERAGSGGTETWGTGANSDYVLVVRTRDGRVEQVGTWHAVPGATMRLAAGTSASRDQIASVEVRTAQGQPVLRLVA